MSQSLRTGERLPKRPGMHAGQWETHQSSQAARSDFNCFKSALRVYIMCPAS